MEPTGVAAVRREFDKWSSRQRTSAGKVAGDVEALRRELAAVREQMRRIEGTSPARPPPPHTHS